MLYPVNQIHNPPNLVTLVVSTHHVHVSIPVFDKLPELDHATTTEKFHTAYFITILCSRPWTTAFIHIPHSPVFTASG
ncbi:hypothetical protein AWENTII_010674 [Aspergillus wentii]